MTIQRITELSEPPIIGRYYLVPTVLHPWHWRSKPYPWPVFLPRHNDAQFLNFPDQHFHIDPRFVTDLDYGRAGEWRWEETSIGTFQRAPLARERGALARAGEPPEPIWRRRICRRTDEGYAHSDYPTVRKLHTHYASQTAPRNRHGWVCPHQNYPTGSLTVTDGVITCPLHGLRIRASDGLCLPASTS